jgi:hypothetical protein
LLASWLLVGKQRQPTRAQHHPAWQPAGGQPANTRAPCSHLSVTTRWPADSHMPFPARFNRFYVDCTPLFSTWFFKKRDSRFNIKTQKHRQPMDNCLHPIEARLQGK